MFGLHFQGLPLCRNRSTVFKWLTPNDKLATYGLDDPEVEGVACHFTVPEKGWPQGLDRRRGTNDRIVPSACACARARG
jgi:catabolite regulation protein CreA